MPRPVVKVLGKPLKTDVVSQPHAYKYARKPSVPLLFSCE